MPLNIIFRILLYKNKHFCLFHIMYSKYSIKILFINKYFCKWILKSIHINENKKMFRGQLLRFLIEKMRNQCIYCASIIMFSYRISYQILCFNMYWLLSVSYVLLNDFSQWARNVKYLLCDVIIENKFIICFSYSNFLSRAQ